MITNGNPVVISQVFIFEDGTIQSERVEIFVFSLLIDELKILIYGKGVEFFAKFHMGRLREILFVCRFSFFAGMGVFECGFLIAVSSKIWPGFICTHATIC